MRGTLPTIIALMAIIVSTAIATDGPCSCAGDCDASCSVDSSDLQQAVHAIFDSTQLLDCAAADADLDGRVTAADLLIINHTKLAPPVDCTSVATATPRSSAPPTRSEQPTPTVVPTPTPLTVPRSQWFPLAPLARGGRQEVGVAALDERIYVVGGFTENLAPTGRVEAYSITEDRWIDIAPLPAAGHHIGAASVGGHLYAIGGLRSPGFTPTDDVFRYDPVNDRWEEVAPLPTARGAMAIAVANGRIHAIAGQAPGAVADHAAYLPNENRWIRLTDYPIAREHIAATSVDNQIVVVGGRSPLSAEAYRWDGDAGRWQPLPPMLTARAGHAAAVLHGRVIVFGGEGNRQDPNGIFAQVEAYDPTTMTWSSLENMTSPRHGIGAVTVGGRIYVPGGADVQAFGAVATHDALEIDF